MNDSTGKKRSPFDGPAPGINESQRQGEKDAQRIHIIAEQQRQLDESKIEIQRLRNKLGRLREMAYTSPLPGDQAWVSVAASVWREVMRNV